MKIRGSVVSLSFIFPHPPKDKIKKSIQKSNNPSSERLEELLLLGSEITKSADFWPRLCLSPEITMISGPIVVFFFFLASEIPVKERNNL